MKRLNDPLNLILNYAEFRTNPEPYVVRGMVQGAICHLHSGTIGYVPSFRNPHSEFRNLNGSQTMEHLD